MRFSQYAIDSIFFWMKSIIARLKLYNDKDRHTNGDANSEAGNVDNSVFPVTDQTSEGGFKIISKH